MKAAWIYVITNWKSSLGGLLAFVMSVPAAVTAIHQLQTGQKVDWHFTAICLVIAGIGFVTKDASTHSTQLQVAKATSDAIANSDARS